MGRAATMAVVKPSNCAARDATIIRVLVADDHQAMREGLRHILETDTSIMLVGQASSGREAIDMAAGIMPDIILMDVKMQGIDGITATREIKRINPKIVILMFTMFSGEYVKEALEAGAAGYLLKDSSGQEILEAIHQASEGYYPLSPSLVKEMMVEYAQYLKNRRNKILSDRQVQILKLVAEGNNSKEIAQKIFISRSTAKREIREIKDKLEVNDRAQAVTRAINQRLIQLS